MEGSFDPTVFHSIRTTGSTNFPTVKIPSIGGVPMTPNFRIKTDDIVPAIQSLEEYFREGGASLVQAAFQHTYFVDPQAVLNRTPYSPKERDEAGNTIPGLIEAKAPNGRPGTEGRSSLTTIPEPRWPGRGTPVTDSLGTPDTGSAISGETPTTPMHSPRAGTCVICPSGREC